MNGEAGAPAEPEWWSDENLHAEKTAPAPPIPAVDSRADSAWTDTAYHLATPKESRWLSGLALAAVAIGFGLIGAAYWSMQSYRAVSDSGAMEGGGTAEGVELQGVLSRFLQARTWAEKRSFLLDADRLDSIGSAYYQGRDPDELKGGDFAAQAMPDLSGLRDVRILRADRAGHRPVVAMFKRQPDGWKLDWELFAQTYDEALSQFIATPDYAIRTLRVRISRSFTDRSGADGIRVELSDALDPGQRIGIDLPTGTPLTSEVAGGLGGETVRYATVEACWICPGQDGEAVPALQRLVCWGWRGTTGEPVSAPPAIERVHEFAVPSRARQDRPASTAESPVVARSDDDRPPAVVRADSVK